MVNDSSRIKQVQLVEFNILLVLDEICKKIGVNYFLIGGTLLGAVRHHGFIPWDDDIDVGMFRPDYDNFIKAATEYLPEHIFLQTKETDHKVPFNFAKLRNSNTTFIESSVKNLKINHGIYIDIFPFDYYPEKSFVSWGQQLSLTFAKHKINKSLYYPREKKYSTLGKLANLGADFVYKDTYQALSAMDRVVGITKNSRVINNYYGAWGKKEVVPKEWFLDIVQLSFEGNDFPAPAMYDKYLKHIYGDYLSLPPEEDRVTHHFTEMVDVEKPYTFYIL